MKKIIFFLIFLLPLVNAQVTLLPGETQFEVAPLILTPVEDYTKTQQLIGIFGDPYYLMISWNASYLDALERDIGVICYLNCFNLSDEDLLLSCSGIQNCSYVGLPGMRSCTIIEPNYLYNQTNNIACKFYDPANPSVIYTYENKPYIARNFSLINFSMRISIGVVNVGEKITLPIKITNYGLFESAYTTNLTSLTWNVIVKNNFQTSDRITYGESTSTLPQILFFVEQNANFKLLSNSTEDRFYCSVDEDCSYLDEDGINGVCIGNSCYKEYLFQIRAEKMALSDFNFHQIFIFLPLFLIGYIFILKKGP